MNSSKHFYYGIFFLILAQSLVGLNIVCSKQLVDSLPILLLLALRFSLAAIVLLPLHWCTSARKFSIKHHLYQLSKRDWLFLITQAIAAGTLFNCFMLAGLHFTDANIAGVITSTLPAIIAIMSWIILKIPISGKQLACIILATCGLALIAIAKLTSLNSVNSLLGNSLVFLSLIPEAGYYVLNKFHSIKLPVFVFSSLMNVFNAILLLPILFWQHDLLALTSSEMILILILGISTGLFYVLLYFGVQWVDSVMLSLSTAIMPVATVIFAWIFLNEHLTLIESLGMGLVLLSIAAYAR